MKKWWIIALIVIVVLVIISVIALKYLPLTSELKSCAKLQEAVANGEKEFYPIDACYMTVAGKYNTYSPCDKIVGTNGVNTKRSCYLNVAVKIGSIKECEHDGVDASACYSEIAIIRKNEDVCDNINNSKNRDSCLLQIANVKKSSAPCEKIQNETILGICNCVASGEPLTSCIVR